MGPKTSGTTGADFEEHIDRLFELTEEEPSEEKEEGSEVDKNDDEK